MIGKFIKYALLFYVIYTPSIPDVAFLDKNITIPVLTIIFIILNIAKHHSAGRIKAAKPKLIFSGILLIACIYAFMIFILNNEFDFTESRLVQNLLPFCYLYLVSYFFIDKTEEEIFRVLINFAVLQGVLTALMLLIPPLHNISLSLFGMDNHFITDFRIYGIASDFTYATPIYHGFLASLLIYKWLNKEEKVNLIKLGFIVLVIVMNGRTGLLVMFIDVIVFIIGYAIKKMNFIRILKYLIIGIIVLFIAAWGINKFLPQTSRFIARFVNDTTNYFIEGELSGNYEILEKSVSVPHGSELVFGKGLRLYKVSESETGYKKTDIGFVNDIFLGGLIYSGLIYFAYLYFVGKNINDKLIVFVLVITMVIANIKGEAFRSSILIFMMIAMAIMSSKELKYETEQ